MIPLGGDPERFTAGRRLFVESGEGEGAPTRELTIESARPQDDGDVLITFAGVTSREDAQQLSGAYLCVDAAEIRELGDDEWFIHQLVGLRAITPDEEALGTVSDVEEYPGHDMLVVAGPAGERRFPLARAFVQRVDVAAGVVVITPWEEA